MDRFKTYGALILVQVLFGLWPTIGSVALETLSPRALIGFRTIVSAPLLLLLARSFGSIRVGGRDLLPLALLGFLGVAANQMLFAEGLLRAGPINGTVMAVMIPISALIIAVLLGRERITTARLLGIAIACAGVLFLVRAERFSLDDRRFVGTLLMLANTTCYALYLVLGKAVVERLGALRVVGWVFLFGAIELLPLSIPAISAVPWTELPNSVYAALGFIILGPTIGTYALNAYALGRIESSVVAIFVGLQPIIGTLAAWWVVDERITTRAALAAMAIVAGVIITSRERKK